MTRGISEHVGRIQTLSFEGDETRGYQKAKVSILNRCKKHQQKTSPMLKDLHHWTYLVCMIEEVPLPLLKTKSKIFFCYFSLIGIFSCSDESIPTNEVIELPPTIDKKIKLKSNELVKMEFPIVFVEELDQMQEFFKEQHETSFSHVPNKNWMSFTAGKDGILTKILLFGKTNYLISEHYGKKMSGFVRSGNPDTGPKFGKWELSRDDIINQLNNQGLKETQAGWITLRMRGMIPQETGKTYFLVCEKISDERSWFGAFAFGEGNPYPYGRHWLHPEHDLVFRTYVGKTKEQIKREQEQAIINEQVQPNTIVRNSVSQTILQPPPPKPMTPKDSVFLPNSKSESLEIPTPKTTMTEETIQGEVLSPLVFETDTLVEEKKAVPQTKSGKDNETEKSFFNRLFKKTSE